jgi:hypothetical protein
LVTQRSGLHDALGDSFEFVGVRDTAATIFLHDDGHGGWSLNGAKMRYEKPGARSQEFFGRRVPDGGFGGTPHSAGRAAKLFALK